MNEYSDLKGLFCRFPCSAKGIMAEVQSGRTNKDLKINLSIYFNPIKTKTKSNNPTINLFP